MKIDLKENEMVIKASDSSFINGVGNISGKLILTNQRIYFKTIAEEMKKYDLEILPTNIKEVMYFNTSLIRPNGLNVVQKDGKELRFSVKKRNSWGEMINKMY